MTNETSTLRITRGNALTVRVRVMRSVLQDGATTEQAIDLSTATAVKALLTWGYVRRKAIGFTVSGNRLIIDLAADTPPASYGLEVSGNDQDGIPWRAARKPGEFIDIVEFTTEATGGDASGICDIDMTAAPSTLTTETLARIDAAVDNANNAARLARESVSGVTFADSVDTATTAPTAAGQAAMWEGCLYTAIAAAGGTLTWEREQP